MRGGRAPLRRGRGAQHRAGVVQHLHLPRPRRRQWPQLRLLFGGRGLRDRTWPHGPRRRVPPLLPHGSVQRQHHQRRLTLSRSTARGVHCHGCQWYIIKTTETSPPPTYPSSFKFYRTDFNNPLLSQNKMCARALTVTERMDFRACISDWEVMKLLSKRNC